MATLSNLGQYNYYVSLLTSDQSYIFIMKSVIARITILFEALLMQSLICSVSLSGKKKLMISTHCIL